MKLIALEHVGVARTRARAELPDRQVVEAVFTTFRDEGRRGAMPDSGFFDNEFVSVERIREIGRAVGAFDVATDPGPTKLVMLRVGTNGGIDARLSAGTTEFANHYSIRVAEGRRTIAPTSSEAPRTSSARSKEIEAALWAFDRAASEMLLPDD